MLQVPTRPMNELHPEMPKFHKSLATQSAKGLDPCMLLLFCLLTILITISIKREEISISITITSELTV